MLSDGTFHETLEITLMKIVVSVDLQLRLLIPCSLRQRNLLGRPDPSLLVFNLVLACYGTQSVKIVRSEEHTSELQSLMRISYAVFCLKKKNNNKQSLYY